MSDFANQGNQSGQSNQGGQSSGASMGVQYINTGTVEAREAEARQAEEAAKAENNDGQEFDFNTFWKGPEGKEDKPSKDGKPADDSDPSGQPGDRPQNGAAQLKEKIDNLAFGEMNLSDEDIEAINNGDLSPLSKSMADVGRQTVMHTIATLAPMLQQMQEGLTSSLSSKIEAALQSDKADGALHSSILSGVAEDKREYVKPVAQAFMQQAMKRNNGNVEKATRETKMAISGLIEGLAGSVDLHTAPLNSGNDGSSDGNSGGDTDWAQFAKDLTR